MLNFKTKRERPSVAVGVFKQSNSWVTDLIKDFVQEDDLVNCPRVCEYLDVTLSWREFVRFH